MAKPQFMGSLFLGNPLPPAETFSQDLLSVLQLLGVGAGIWVLMLWLLWHVVSPGNLKRIVLCIAAIDLLIALLSVHLLQPGPSLEPGSPWERVGWGPVALFHLAMACGFLLTGLRAWKLEGAGTEAFELRSAHRDHWLRRLGEAAAQEERNRLARDLHDSIKQQLFSIKMSAAAAEASWDNDPGKARQALRDVRQSSQAAMVEMQALLHQLRPEALATVGLVEALREQCEALEYRTGARVDFQLGSLPPDDQLPPGVQETLFRVAQEALSNVARHARATQVQVWLGEVAVDRGRFLVLRVRDDGQGFIPAEPSHGMGLRSMRERVEELQGSFELASSRGAGTELTAGLPIQVTPSSAPQGWLSAQRLHPEWMEGSVSPSLIILTGMRLFSTGPQFLSLGLLLALIAIVNSYLKPSDSSRFYSLLHFQKHCLILYGLWGGLLVRSSAESLGRSVPWWSLPLLIFFVLALGAEEVAFFKGLHRDRREGHNLTASVAPVAVLLGISLSALAAGLISSQVDTAARIALGATAGLYFLWSGFSVFRYRRSKSREEPA